MFDYNAFAVGGKVTKGPAIPKSFLIEVFGGVFVLSICSLEFSVDVSAFS